MIEKNLIRQARQTNLADYLLSIGEPLMRNGDRYKHKEHDSLVFTKNAYYWNSKQEHGNAIDYLMRHKDMTFTEAISALIAVNSVNAVDDKQDTQIETLSLNDDCKRVIAYLTKTRQIDYKLVTSMIKSNYIYQELNTNNIIFPMYDEHGVCVGAELQGTLSDRRFKGIKSSSKYGYGFNIRYSNNDNFEYLMVFESGIDLLSFIDLVTNIQHKTLDSILLVSMGGLKTNIVKHTLNAFKGDLKLYLCVDNDNAGSEFQEALKALKIDFKLHKPESIYKDWNEQLQAKKKKS